MNILNQNIKFYFSNIGLEVALYLSKNIKLYFSNIGLEVALYLSKNKNYFLMLTSTIGMF